MSNTGLGKKENMGPLSVELLVAPLDDPGDQILQIQKSCLTIQMNFTILIQNERSLLRIWRAPARVTGFLKLLIHMSDTKTNCHIRYETNFF